MTQVLADDENATPSLWKRPSLWASLVTAGVVGGAALNSFTDNPRNDFRVEHEGWFGERR
jgi:hypothetical protein